MTVPQGRCDDCYRALHERPDSKCRSGQHTGQSQPAPWPKPDAAVEV